MVVRLNLRTLTVHEAPAQPAAAPTSEWDTEDTSTRRPRKPTSRSRNADGEDCDRHYTASFGVSLEVHSPYRVGYPWAALCATLLAEPPPPVSTPCPRCSQPR